MKKTDHPAAIIERAREVAAQANDLNRKHVVAKTIEQSNRLAKRARGSYLKAARIFLLAESRQALRDAASCLDAASQLYVPGCE